jgi:hypothetical protein
MQVLKESSKTQPSIRHTELALLSVLPMVRWKNTRPYCSMTTIAERAGIRKVLEQV